MPDSQPQTSATKSLIERDFRGVNLTAGITALADGEFLQLDNFIPMGPGNLALVPASALLIPAGTPTIYQIWALGFSSQTVIFAQGTDGSVWSCAQPGATWTQIAAAGATTMDGLHFALWRGVDAEGNPEAALWVDTVKGYGSATATTWTTLVATLVGQALCVYSGRVWVASGTQITFTAPDCYNDFLAEDFAGDFHVTDPTLQGPVYALVTAQGWLYIIGSGMVALNNVQVQAVGGSTTLVTTYYITGVSQSIGVVNDRAALVVDNMLVIITDSGLWTYYGLNGKLVSANMGTNFAGNMTLMGAQIFGRNVVVCSNGYVWNVDQDVWFTISASQSWTATASINSGSPMGYIVEANAVSQFASAPTTVTSGTVTSKLYDCGNPTLAKRAQKVGYEYYNNQFPDNGNAVPQPQVTVQLLGFVNSSEAFQTPRDLPTTNLYVRLGNVWTAQYINLVDRYIAVKLQVTSTPGFSISQFAFQFMDTTDWPPSNILPASNSPCM